MSHGHGDHRSIAIFFLHGQGRIQEGQYIPFRLGHHSIFHQITAQFLHLHQAADDHIFIRGILEIVTGTHDLDTRIMGCLNDGPDGFFSP